ncbi:PadR family transcriptional regulator [Ferruginivarius sediminum]|uniref:PadR family transcriptional regulator n=1 Tax=Ferruginivarius sediminum TaxID=2661937 RepID=A0A369T8W5_9PROT|nr:PadR family transcriptional regulator [Ferruginivarius sediminum]RDD61332.1 PadR family transcriptional regulator [Ferruginivarius sediminum]
MDTQTLCLGVLNRGAASGYEIKKSFEEGPLAHIHEASFGAIYPALSRLAADGLVEYCELPQDKRPDKKVYSITSAGRRALEKALHHPPAADKFRSDFCFILFFAHLLPAEELARLIDARIHWYDETLARMEECEELGEHPAGERFVHGLGLAVYRAARNYLCDHRDDLLRDAAVPADTAAE